MLTRVHIPLALMVLASCACAPAQTAKPKPPPPLQTAKAFELPAIDHNVKLTVNENAAQLLLNTDVQRDMGMSAETKKALVKVYGAFEAKYTSLTAGYTSLGAGKTEGSDDLAARLDAAMVDTANQAVALLSPSESARLRQIGVQAMGFDALRMPEVRKGMSLSADQTAQLDKVLADVDDKQSALDTELGARLSRLPDPGTKATDEETAANKKAQLAVAEELEPQHKAIVEVKKAGWDALMGSLTLEQKTAWHALHGKPVVGL